MQPEILHPITSNLELSMSTTLAANYGLISINPTDAWSIYAVKMSSFSSLAFILYEAMITLGDESLWIYALPTFSPTRCLYMFTKYFAIIVQIINAIATHHILSKYPVTDDWICRTWFTLRVAASLIILMSVEMIIMLRVYALFLCSRRMGAFLVSVLFFELSLVANTINVLHVYGRFNYVCLTVQPPETLSSAFGSVWGSIFSQIIMLCLTFFKHNRAVRSGQRLQILYLMVRDGFLAFLILSVILITPMVGSLFHHEGACVIMSLFISVSSSAGCRMIINMQEMRVDLPESYNSDTDQELTAVLDIETLELQRFNTPALKDSLSWITVGGTASPY